MEKKIIGKEIKRLNNLIRRAAERFDCVRESDRVTDMHGYIIGYLYQNRTRDIFQRDIEQVFSIRRSTVTEILQRMEAGGMIVRQSVPQDKRLKKIVLTERAEAIHSNVVSALHTLELRMQNNISAQELSVFFTVADKIAENLTKEISTQTAGER